MDQLARRRDASSGDDIEQIPHVLPAPANKLHVSAYEILV